MRPSRLWRVPWSVLYSSRMQESSTAEDAALAWLRERALVAADLPIMISDAVRPDNPLVWVNAAFERVTGYSSAATLGRNCRFLQGQDSDPAAVTKLRVAIAQERSVTVTILNYRSDGSSYWNQVSVSPVRDLDGRLVSWVGIQTDVSERVEAEAARAQAFAAELAARKAVEDAHAETEKARRRLGLLADATTLLASTLDVGETLDRLTRLVVPVLADWVTISLVDAHGRTERTAARHCAGNEELLARYQGLIIDGLTEDALSRRVMQAGAPQLVVDVQHSDWEASVTSEELVGVVEALGVGSAMYIPLIARDRRVIGSISFVAAPSGRVFTADDLAVAADIGRRASITLDNARLYEREHRVAETLQRSLLPNIPDVDGLSIAARYVPSDATVDVGGDFYEVLPLPDGSVGIAVGDVVGHDLSAAAAMGHLRGLLQAAAWADAEDGTCDPAKVLDRVDSLVQGLDVVPLATLLYGRLQQVPTQPGWWSFTYANAGHPPALIRTADSTVRTLDDTQGVLLGVSKAAARPTARVDLSPGTTLVAFTDGLVERRGDSLEEGYRRLVEAVHRHADHPERLVDDLLRAAGPDGDDDTAILAIRVPDSDARQPEPIGPARTPRSPRIDGEDPVQSGQTQCRQDSRPR